MMENSFVINGKLPGLNEYTNACRSHWTRGAEMKREAEMLICWSIVLARRDGLLRDVKKPVRIRFDWTESTKRRDLDNIFSAKKYILDAMQRMGVIQGDGRKHIFGLQDEIHDGTTDGVKVTIIEDDKDVVESLQKQIEELQREKDAAIMEIRRMMAVGMCQKEGNHDGR